MPDLLLIGLGPVSAGLALGLGAAALQDAVNWFNERTTGNLEARMRALGMDVARLPQYLQLWRGAIVVTLLVVWFALDAPPLALFLAFLVHQLVPVWFEVRIAAHLRRIREQVAGAARLLTSHLRAGLALEEAVTAVSHEVPEPFGWHLRQTATGLAQGRQALQVLEDLRARLRIDAVALLVIALRVAAERGGKLTEVLERLGGSLESLQRVRRKRETDTAAGRLMVLLMAVFPAAFLGLFYLLDASLVTPLFSSFRGQLVLCTVGLLVYASVRWAARILAQVE